MAVTSGDVMGAASNSLPNIFAIDDGNRNIKILSREIKLCIPSRVQVGPLQLIAMGGGNIKDNYEYSIEVKNKDRAIFSVGKDLESSVHVASDDYCYSDYNRVLVYHALRQASAKGQVELVTGLPLKQYYRGRSGSINDELINKKDESLLKNNVLSSNFEELTKLDFKIVSNTTMAEAISSWLDVVITLDDHGGAQYDDELISKKIAIVDIGGRTTDIAVVRDYSLDIERSTTIDIGMLKVRDKLRDVFIEMYSEEFSIPHLDSAIETGFIEYFGEQCDVSADVERIYKDLAKEIETEVVRVLGRGSDLTKIIFTGGGSVRLFEKYLSHIYPRNSRLADDALFSNASGMYKYGLMALV